MSKFLLFAAVFVSLLASLATADVLVGAEFKAGIARANITPTEPMWLSGYGARTRPADGKLTDLWAKVLVLQDATGAKTALVTLDLVGIDRGMSERISAAMKKDHGFDRARVALCSSHTHSGPVVGENLRAMYFLDAEQEKRIAEYTRKVESQIVAAVAEASASLKPVKLTHGLGKTTFATNRRTNVEKQVPELRAAGKLVGPVDHDVPVLVVRGDDDKVAAVVFSYACHATVLDGYQWCGDWPGYAQIEIEKAFPGATALFVAGCGGDQNPLPRRKVELAQEYGRRMAVAVTDVVAAPMMAVGDSLACEYGEIDLPFAKLPTKEEIERDKNSSNKYEASRAKLLAETIKRDGKLSSTYPYPIQTWRFTASDKHGAAPLTMVLLGGEVVIDYSLRIKQDHAAANSPGTTWVAAYCNDVMAYIPSRRVLLEGGYEGSSAMLYYGLPSAWADNVENLIHSEVRRQGTLR